MRTIEGKPIPDYSLGQKYLDSKIREWQRERAKIKEAWLHQVLPELMPKQEIEEAVEKFDSYNFKKHGILILHLEYSEHQFDAMTVLQHDQIKFSKLFPR